MPSDLVIAATGSPPPREPAVSRRWLAVTLVVPPLVWFLQTVAGFVLVANGCTRPGADGGVLAEGWGWLWEGLLIMNLAAAAIAGAAVLGAVAMWRRAQGEAEGRTGGLVDAEEGSDRFLASWGILGGATFYVLGTLFATILIVLVPLCAS